MTGHPRTIALLEIPLLFPAVLFMTALIVRSLPPPPSALVVSAGKIVRWYADRVWTLWILLGCLPISSLSLGCVTLLRTWKDGGIDGPKARQQPPAVRLRPATLIVAAETLISGAILAVVAVHVLMN